MKPDDYLRTAERLVALAEKRPAQGDLRKACSATYYALFHTLCESNANMLVDSNTKRAWSQVYRAIDHGPARDLCEKTHIMTRFPSRVQDFANMFVSMQKKRHKADYDPYGPPWKKSAVLNDIKGVRAAIRAFKKVPAKHRRAFAAYLLIKNRPI